MDAQRHLQSEQSSDLRRRQGGVHPDGRETPYKSVSLRIDQKLRNDLPPDKSRFDAPLRIKPT